jgi:UDP-N-acetylglucosamine transferase subunit ALG13
MSTTLNGAALRIGRDPLPASVFVTVGTDHHPFHRLISWVDGWLDRGAAECFVQYGTSQPPSAARGSAFLSHSELSRHIAQARVVVCHGGPGTIIDCLRSGSKPIVVPREKRRGEHVDDHQVRFAGRLERSSLISIARTPEELARMIDDALTGRADRSHDGDAGALSGSIAAFDALVAPLLMGSPSVLLTPSPSDERP